MTFKFFHINFQVNVHHFSPGSVLFLTRLLLPGRQGLLCSSLDPNDLAQGLT